MRKRIVFWTCLLLGIVLIVVTAKYLIAKPKVEERVKISTVIGEPVRVVRVIDGDTIEVLINDKKDNVRLIGIDAPESVAPNKKVECFAKESSEKAKEILEGKMVKLEKDESQADRDIYGRLLRYVILDDGTNFDRQMITEGYAREYTFRSAYKYQKEFRESQVTAKEKEIGLWAACGK